MNWAMSITNGWQAFNGSVKWANEKIIAKGRQGVRIKARRRLVSSSVEVLLLRHRQRREKVTRGMAGDINELVL